VGEKEFVWGPKQVRQNYMCKVEERDRVMLAAVSANVVEFLKKNSALTQVGVN